MPAMASTSEQLHLAGAEGDRGAVERDATTAERPQVETGRHRGRRDELDLHQPGQRPDGAQRERVRPVPRRAEIDDRGHVATGVVHRRRVADPVHDRFAPVLGGEDGRRPVGDEGHGDAVGAGDLLVPATAGDQPDVLGRPQRARTGRCPRAPDRSGR